MYHVYVIEADNGRKYIGMSGNLNERIREHNENESFWTKRYKNWKKIYQKGFETYTEARKWEIYLKGQKGGNGLKRIVFETNELARGS